MPTPICQSGRKFNKWFGGHVAQKNESKNGVIKKDFQLYYYIESILNLLSETSLLRYRPHYLDCHLVHLAPPYHSRVRMAQVLSVPPTRSNTTASSSLGEPVILYLWGLGRDKKKVVASLDSAGVLCPGVTVGDLLEDGSAALTAVTAPPQSCSWMRCRGNWSV
jgi:hypothetical protein